MIRCQSQDGLSQWEGEWIENTRPCAFVIASVYHVHLTRVQIVRPATRCTFALTHTGLLLRVDIKHKPVSPIISSNLEINKV